MSVQEPANKAAQALYQAMIGATGPEATGWTGALDLPPARREGQSVLILGAGVAGLTAAYELTRLGYACTVLEAQDRTGGRNRTARRGDELYETDPTGTPVLTHTCSFNENLYLNLGPGRIPHHHRRVVQYCSELRVELEPYIMETTANVVSLSKSAPARWRNRQVAHDIRGHIASLLSGKLTEDDEFTENLRDLLRNFGMLDVKGEYHGSTRSGFEELDVHEFPRPLPPLDFRELVESKFWNASFYQPVDYLWQDTMFQPVGGMDKIVEAFTQKITQEYGEIIKLEAEVTSITLPEEGGVVVEYLHEGETRTQRADYCVSSIPLPVLRDVALSNFSLDFTEAIAAVGFAPTCKVGWQANTRFWEDDQNAIYGGISWTDHNITQMWYPSNDYFSSDGGTLTGAYNFRGNAEELGALAPDKRLELARRGAIELHPEFENKDIIPPQQGITIAWHKVPHQLGGWAAWDPGSSEHMIAYKQLLQPEGDGRFFVVGDQASPLPGWQEGAMMSAHYVTSQIVGIMPLTVPEVVRVPDSVALTEGHH
ncbi:flavin monoamine oxidase family protein [Streptomyces sp. NPDC058619]|uniref:flavin monoamine oxidase family protein n=1 Tax=unclassified Streptomyces TaxID=2593676 RepID=UPI003651A041